MFLLFSGAGGALYHGTLTQGKQGRVTTSVGQQIGCVQGPTGDGKATLSTGGENRCRTFTCLGPKEPRDGAERQALKGHPVPSLPGLPHATIHSPKKGFILALVSESSWGDRGSPSIDEK